MFHYPCLQSVIPPSPHATARVSLRLAHSSFEMDSIADELKKCKTLSFWQEISFDLNYCTVAVLLSVILLHIACLSSYDVDRQLDLCPSKIKRMQIIDYDTSFPCLLLLRIVDVLILFDSRLLLLLLLFYSHLDVYISTSTGNQIKSRRVSQTDASLWVTDYHKNRGRKSIAIFARRECPCPKLP